MVVTQTGPRKILVAVGVGLALFGFAAYYLYRASNDPPSVVADLPESNGTGVRVKLTAVRRKGKSRRSRFGSPAMNGTNLADGNESASSSAEIGVTTSSGSSFATGTSVSTAVSPNKPSKTKEILKQVLAAPIPPPIVPTNPDT